MVFLVLGAKDVKSFWFLVFPRKALAETRVDGTEYRLQFYQQFCSALTLADIHSAEDVGVCFSHIGNQNVGEQDECDESHQCKDNHIDDVIMILFKTEVGIHQHLIVVYQ